jgi:c-di-GMP-binding flagellar brake protein YcgR
MERRRARRVTINLKAERISCVNNCSVFIENISETGINMISAPGKKNDYIPGTEMDLELEMSNGKTINLKCNVKWAEHSPEEKSKSVGLEIINPPLEYKEFLETLH